MSMKQSTGDLYQQGWAHTLMVVAATISALVVLFLWGEEFVSEKSSTPGPRLTSSVTNFGYNETRTGHVFSHINTTTPLKLEAGKTALSRRTQNALPFMPLYINGTDIDDDFILNRRVLIVATGHGLEAIDVDTAELLWSVGLRSGLYIAATPVIDLDTRKVYFYSRGYDKQTGYEHQIYQVGFNGEGLRSLAIPIDPIFESRYPQLSGSEWGKRVHCKTSLGLNRKVIPSYLFFGCSVQTGTDADSRYGALRSLSGLVINVFLDHEGNLKKPQDLRIFMTSEMRAGRNTGFDSGIYNSGAGPALLHDGSILIATGNGPVFPELGNFGCSIVRLDGTNLRPIRNQDGSPAAFSYSETPYNECWHLNIEYASSSISVIKTGAGLTAAVMTKDGFLDVFNPLQMDPSRNGVTRTRVANGKTHSQPVMIRIGDKIRIIALAKGRPENTMVNDTFLVDAGTLANMSTEAKSVCYGWLSNSPNGNAPGLGLLFSGPIRNDYAVAIEGGDFNTDLTSFFSSILGSRNDRWLDDGLWGPYVKVIRLGYSLGPDFRADIPLSRLERFESTWKYFDEQKQTGSPYKHEEFWLLRNLDKNRDCHLSTEPGLTAIYEGKRQWVTYEGHADSITAHDYNPADGSLRQVWRITLRDPDHLMDAHPLISSNARGNHSIALILAYSDGAGSQAGSAMLMINIETGELIKRIEFSGIARFSMPLVFDEKIMIPTLGNGLRIFSIQKDPTAAREH